MSRDTPTPPARAWIVWSTLSLLVMLGLWGPRILSEQPLADEKVYLAAVLAAGAGLPLSEVEGWYYPDAAALLGAALATVTGELPMVWGLRALNLLGLGVTLGWMLARLPGRWAWLGLLALSMAPLVRSAATAGNVSGLLVGLLCVSLVGSLGRWRTPLVMLGFLFKPYGLVRALDLPWVSRILVLSTAAFAWFFTSNRGALVNLGSVRNASPARALIELGLALPWQAWTGGILLWALWRRPRGVHALAVGWLCLPLSWDHTALLVVPLLGEALARPRPVMGDLRLGRVCIGLAALILADTGGYGLMDGPRWASGLIGLFPALAVLVVLWIVGPAGETDPSVSMPMRRSTSTR